MKTTDGAGDMQVTQLTPALEARTVGGAGDILSALPTQAECEIQVVPPPEGGGNEVGPEALSLEVATSRGGRANEEEEEPEECWICRNAESEEPLIRPCACRGTMSGVHASCVETWISHHRQHAVDSEAPQCSVCHQPYSGSDQRPGFSEFASHQGTKCWTITKMTLRMAVLITAFVLFMVYVHVPKDDVPQCPLSIKAATVTVVTLFALFKAAVLFISMPTFRDDLTAEFTPPQHACLRYFFARDDDFNNHALEAIATFLFLGLGCSDNINDLIYFLPFSAILSVPFIKLVVENLPPPSTFCWELKECCWCLSSCLLSPIMLLVLLVAAIIRYPAPIAQRVAHPLDAGWHMLVVLVTFGIVLFDMCQDAEASASNAVLVITWAIHSVLLLVALVEIFCVKRLTWRPGQPWAIAWVLSLFSVGFAPLFVTEGFGERSDHVQAIVLAVSITWCALLGCLAARVNWRFMGQNYRAWQERNSRFTVGNAVQVPLVD